LVGSGEAGPSSLAHALHFPGAGPRNERDAPLVLASPKEEELAGILAHIEPVKIGALFDRTVSFRYTSSVDSVNGAIECGGRFNPPYRLVRELCGPKDGFGYLYTASNPLPGAVMFCAVWTKTISKASRLSPRSSSASNSGARFRKTVTGFRRLYRATTVREWLLDRILRREVVSARSWRSGGSVRAAGVAAVLR